MPLKQYSVLKGRPVDVRQGSGTSPHYQVLVVDDTERYRIAVNVQSQDGSQVLYYVDTRFEHPMLEQLSAIEPGMHPVPSRPGGIALDFIRGNLFQPQQMVGLPIQAPGPDNDLNEKIGMYVQRAMADEMAAIYAFGEPWGPEPKKRDNYFGFLPGRGIHDIHMNQGNPPGRFAGDNGPWQDGGLLFQFPRQGQWVAIFLKFATQAWHTDDRTADALDLAGSGPAGDAAARQPGIVAPDRLPTVDMPDGLVRIVAALVNDTASPERETVTLLNTSHEDVSLENWSLADRMKDRMPLSGTIAAGATRQVGVQPPMTLSNRGGIITLLDSRGVKVHGVSYTRGQAAQPGRTIAF
ncbi:Hypothetical protein HVIM_02079 [Roseomonas mucosa]|uniref:Uncharacterized conserved protein (DUF2278) n=1 Tax=Roseomonas mucosa TaxID=207340 RepID=A0A1S8D9U0_9PROT|nr:MULTISPECIES: DUF2278 family protein [Roseomonas]MBS5901727.1 DUF2278 family protein [Acetobacteraceae bacterium]MCG7350468.1 DUF2278 family protein [Roseomonas mucosa]MCG7355769.1 DUF2278 family protein [Roseomonas mucosa]MDT8289301.1 DUF2278 family protein [Roseomonas mucosa]MDT8292421.1 DUF2278 family protein [Roseomonas mucosa]